MALGLNTHIPTTKGYKTMETIKIGDEIFGYENKPTKVIDVLHIHKSLETYLLTFISINDECIQVISDENSKFSILQNGQIRLVACKELIEGNIIVGLDKYLLLSKHKTDNEAVRCIKVESEEQLFLITDRKESNWPGGESYPFRAVYTK